MTVGTWAAFGGCVAAVSLVALAQMTSHVSQTANSNAQASSSLLRASGLRPGEQVAVDSNLSWPLWVPQAFEISWTELQLLQPGQAAAAGRRDRRGGVLAGRAARAGQLAKRPGRVADRRLRPGQRLGGLARASGLIPEGRNPCHRGSSDTR